MPSETINQLVGSLNELQSKLNQLDGEARRLGDLRGDLKSTAAGLAAAARELQTVTTALGDGAATMRELDMTATLARLAEIETALDARSRLLEQAIDREIAELGESLKHQVSKQLDALPAQIGPTVALAFDRQFAATKTAIDSLVTDARTNHQSLTAIVQNGVSQVLQDSTARSTAAALATTQIQATIREAQSTPLASIMKALAEAEARNASQAKLLEAALLSGTGKTRFMATLAAIVATIGAIAAVVSIFF